MASNKAKNNKDDYVSEYYVVRSSALPEVYNNTMKVKVLLQSGDVSSVNEAVKKVGMSRSAYYKYRDDIRVYHNPLEQDQITITATYLVNSDALAELVYYLSNSGNKILNIAQSLPRGGFCDIMFSCTLGPESKDLLELRRNLNRIPGVRQVDILNN